MRGRVGVLTLLVLAPISAELLAAYLGDVGGAGGLLFLVAFFAPLYGGAALLIREVAVRTGRGWRGILLLAAAFGVLMPTFVDGSLFTTARDDVDDWSSIVNAASFGGVGWYAVVTWVGGHVLMSVGAPIAVAQALARRPGPWLGRLGITVTVVAFVLVALLVHRDQWDVNEVESSPARYAVAGAIVVALVAVALSPLGRPAGSRPGRTPAVWRCAVGGFVGLAAFDFVPMSWAGVAVDLTVLSIAFAILTRWGTTAGWTARHVAAVAWGALLARTLTGFLAPLPQETTWTEKISQNVTYLLLIALLGVVLQLRTRAEPSPSVR